MPKAILVEDAVLRDTFWNAAIDLKKENEALKQRIRELESVVNDPEVLWSNWLRGTVKLPSGIGDVRQYQARINRLEELGKELRQCASWVGHACCEYADQIRRAEAAVEAWDKEAKP